MNMAFQAISREMDYPATEHAQEMPLGIRVHDSLDAARADWQELERRGAIYTPYQRFDWISAYLQAGFPGKSTLSIIVFHDRGKPVALLPLSIARQQGVMQGRIIGMPISNSDSLVFDPAYVNEITPDLLRKAFAHLRAEGQPLDLVSFHYLIKDWRGIPNPLLGFPHAPAPNHFYFDTFPPGETPFIEQSFPHKRRTNIRRSARRLTEGFGPLSVRLASTEEQIDRFHAAFLEQRGRRFAKMGVENVFARPQFQTLFLSLSKKGLGSTHPVLRYHALFTGEDIVATSLGVYANGHYSQYINSTTDGEASKYSLMGVLLSMLVDELRADGITVFDMGLGDFDYKTDWTRPVIVYDSLVPVSPLGAIAVPAFNGARRLKRAIKQTPALWKMARALQTVKTRLRSGKSGS